MEVKISLKKTQFLVNLLFICTLIVWLFCDFARLWPTVISPANHIIFEFPAMVFLGSLFATNTEEPCFLWPLIIMMLIFPPIVWGLFDGHLMSALSFNLIVISSFLIGYFIQKHEGIVKK